MDAFELLHEDCWRLVFRRLNVEELLKCRLVSSEFNQLVDDKLFKRKWQFHLILPLIFKHLKDANVEEPWKPWKHLPKVRLVCSSWREAVDMYATNEAYNPSAFRLTSPLATNFFTAEDIDEFLNRFGDWNSNPFPSRTVIISPVIEGPEQGQPGRDEAIRALQNGFIEKVGNFLDRFGEDVFKFKLFFDLEDNAGAFFLCKLIQKTSTRLPNVNSFLVQSDLNIEGEIVMDFGQDNDQEDDLEEENDSDQEEEEVEEEEDFEEAMEAFIEENELGDLPELKVLQINSLNSSLKDYLLDKYAPQLITFEMEFTLSLLKQVNTEQFNNLRKLTVELLYGNHDENLEALRSLKSPLNILKLSFYRFVDTIVQHPQTWNVDKFLRNVKHLPIDTLKISFLTDVIVEEEGIRASLYKNDSIRILSIRTDYDDIGGEISFNFLQALKTLEKFSFKFRPDQTPTIHPEGRRELVKLNDYIVGQEETDMPYQSNVWEKVPSLNTLVVKRKQLANGNFTILKSIYTREEYDEI